MNEAKISSQIWRGEDKMMSGGMEVDSFEASDCCVILEENEATQIM